MPQPLQNQFSNSVACPETVSWMSSLQRWKVFSFTPTLCCMYNTPLALFQSASFIFVERGWGWKWGNLKPEHVKFLLWLTCNQAVVLKPVHLRPITKGMSSVRLAASECGLMWMRKLLSLWQGDKKRCVHAAGWRVEWRSLGGVVEATSW